jgi:predicted transcriptional regulator
MKSKTQTERVLAFLQNGNDLTEGQARSKFGVRNMSALASYLRGKGYAVYNNHKTIGNGNTISVFRLGTPSRAIVAAGYRALRAA